MINELIKLSTHLDEIGLTKEADYLDVVIKRASKVDGLSGDSGDNVLYKMKCAADQMLAPQQSAEGGESHQAALPKIEARHNKWRVAWAKHEKLSEEQRIDVVAYLDKLKADREMTPPKYGGYTCPKSVKWLPIGVVWTGDGAVVTKGVGEWK